MKAGSVRKYRNRLARPATGKQLYLAGGLRHHVLIPYRSAVKKRVRHPTGSFKTPSNPFSIDQF